MCGCSCTKSHLLWEEFFSSSLLFFMQCLNSLIWSYYLAPLFFFFEYHLSIHFILRCHILVPLKAH
jgi:hypothetical protein